MKKYKLSNIHIRSRPNEETLKMNHVFDLHFIEPEINFGWNFYEKLSITSGFSILFLKYFDQKYTTISRTEYDQKYSLTWNTLVDDNPSYFSWKISLYYQIEKYFFQIKYSENLYRTQIIGHVSGVDSFQYSLSIELGFYFIVREK